MKKQKFNGKLRLKKNIISGFNAAQVRGGGPTDVCLSWPECQTDFCNPTDASLCPCATMECSLGCPWPETQALECITQEASCPCQ